MLIGDPHCLRLPGLDFTSGYRRKHDQWLAVTGAPRQQNYYVIGTSKLPYHLSIESKLARKLSFSDSIETFASKKQERQFLITLDFPQVLRALRKSSLI